MGRSKRKAGSDDHNAQSKITKQKYAAYYQAARTTDPEFTTWIRPVAEDRRKDCREGHHEVYSVSLIFNTKTAKLGCLN